MFLIVQFFDAVTAVFGGAKVEHVSELEPVDHHVNPEQ